MLFEEKHSKNNYYTTLCYDDIICLPHCQSSFEILFVKSGSVSAHIGNRILKVSCGECIWVLPYEVHYFVTDKQSEVFISIFSTDYIPDFYNEVSNKSLCNPICNFENKDIQILSSKEKYVIKSVLYNLCNKAIKSGVLESNETISKDLATKIMIYIQDNFKNQINLKTLSDYLGYSYSYTSLIFKNYFNRGFSDLINDYRLDFAVKLLKETDLKITAICNEAGFTTLRNFNISFKKRYNLTPKEYRMLK